MFRSIPVLFVLLSATPTLAGSSTTSFAVTATVVPNCRTDTPPTTEACSRELQPRVHTEVVTERLMPRAPDRNSPEGVRPLRDVGLVTVTVNY
jgi:hypothetical protein